MKHSKIDIIVLAKSLVGKALWKSKPELCEQPSYFDCSTLINWLYMQIGILIPVGPYQQFEYCCVYGQEIKLEHIEIGDFVFITSPWVGKIRVNPQAKFGHVGIVSEYSKIICATNSELGKGVIEIGFDKLFATRSFCGAGRIIS